MGLSARERQALFSIEGGLAESDPDLVAKLAFLSRLMAGNPAAGGRLAGMQLGWLPRVRGQAPEPRHSGLASALLALWLVVACGLIATAAALSHTPAGRSCPVLAVHCASQTPLGSMHGSAR
jgi:hypothetical protein